MTPRFAGAGLESCFPPAILRLKGILECGAIGQVYRISQERLKHGRVKVSEGMLPGFASHDLAVLLLLMGEAPREVLACGAGFLPSGGQDDVHLELGFSGGRSAHLHVSWYWPGERVGLQVLGANGMITYDEKTQSLSLHRKHLAGSGWPDPLAPMDFGTYSLFVGDEEPSRLKQQPFPNGFVAGEIPRNDGPKGLEVARVLERASCQLRHSRHSPVLELI